MGRGQKLGDGDGPFSDSSVEEMLQVIRSLPPEASAVTAISQGLYYLDRCAAWADVVRGGHCLPALAQGRFESPQPLATACATLPRLSVLVLAVAPEPLPISCSAGGVPECCLACQERARQAGAG